MAERFAFQGERGAFSEEALRRYFGEDVEVLPKPTFAEVFEAVAGGEAEAAMVPVENSRAGSVADTVDLLLEHALTIVGELYLPVEHCLMALPGQMLADIREARSHPQALAQCDAFLRAHGIAARVAYDTAGSARELSLSRTPGVAAIASVRAAEIYGLELLARSIQTSRDNTTRFFAICQPERAHTWMRGIPDKTSLVIGTANAPGALHRCLGVFASRAVNLTKIESRPSKRTPWEYVFFLDFEGDIRTAPGQEVLEALAAETAFLRVLGTYPRA